MIKRIREIVQQLRALKADPPTSWDRRYDAATVGELLDLVETSPTFDYAPCVAEPKVLGFEYAVRVAVALPEAWTLLLKQISRHHYDGLCRDVGDHGVINGLHNTRITVDGPASTYPVSWRDLDLITKVMEQAEYHTRDLAMIGRIRDWLRATKRTIEDRHEQISTLTTSPAKV